VSVFFPGVEEGERSGGGEKEQKNAGKWRGKIVGKEWKRIGNEGVRSGKGEKISRKE
jgi:hypothetical protein